MGAGSGRLLRQFGSGNPQLWDGRNTDAGFHAPQGICLLKENLYVADTGNHAIRRVAPDGTVMTIAGDGSAGFQDGRGQSARFNAGHEPRRDRLERSGERDGRTVPFDRFDGRGNRDRLVVQPGDRDPFVARLPRVRLGCLA